MLARDKRWLETRNATERIPPWLRRPKHARIHSCLEISMAETNSQIREELDSLKEDIANLRSDVGELASAVRAAGTEQTRQARSSMEEEVRRAREHLQQTVDQAREYGHESVERAEQRVGEYPFTTLATAFGVGFAIGKLLDVGRRC